MFYVSIEMMTRILIPFLFAVSLCRAAEPDSTVWVFCSGEAPLQNITYEDAQNLAKRQARLNAIEKGCGVSVHSESFVNNFVLAGDFIQALSYGEILEEKDLKWETLTLSASEHTGPPAIVVRLTMSARVKSVSGKPDPSFKLQLDLNKQVYQNGDEVIFHVKASKDCYLTILNLAADDSVYVLFPNDIRRDCRMISGTQLEFPSTEDRERGLRIRVATLSGHSEDNEMIKIIATKQDVPFLDVSESSTGFEAIGTPRVAVARLARWLSEIPISERAEISATYRVTDSSKRE
jgi:hypothetical protein